MLGASTAAVAPARAAGTLGAEFEGFATEAGWRVQGETTLGNPETTRAARELDWFEAERIIDDELVNWQTTRVSAGVVQSTPASRLDPSYI